MKYTSACLPPTIAAIDTVRKEKSEGCGRLPMSPMYAKLHRKG